MPFPGILYATARTVATCALGLGVLWQVSKHAGWGEGEVVVHVAVAPSDSDVSVRIDSDDYPFEPWPGEPLVCSLRPGTHTLTMTRAGQTLHAQTFALAPRGQIVLTAWDPTQAAQPHEYHSPTEPR